MIVKGRYPSPSLILSLKIFIMRNFTIHRSYGGEYPADVVKASTLAEAEELSMACEHAEIYANWCEVGISYIDSGGTETIHSTDHRWSAVTYAKKYFQNLKDNEPLEYKEIDFMFIDVWCCLVEPTGNGKFINYDNMKPMGGNITYIRKHSLK